jgi:predicted glycosyltransferase
VRRYEGFKEELYLAGFSPDTTILDELGLDGERVIAVFRAPPDGALYHRDENNRFDELLDAARARPDVQTVLLPRTKEHERAFRALDGVVVPDGPVDGRSLLACADLAIGGGGTMSRESALLGTPTYTVFAGKLACVDAELIRSGLMQDLRDPGASPQFEKRAAPPARVPAQRADAILAAMTAALADVA